MDTKYFWVILLIIIIAQIIFILNKQADKDSFEDYILPVEKIEDLNNLKLDSTLSKNIFVGTGDKINSNVNLGTNETIFIKDGIKIQNAGGENILLDIDTIKNIKYLPYNFKEELCIGNECINKYHIKMLKGEIPFSMNTFFKSKPFQLYKGADFWVLKYYIGADRRVTLNSGLYFPVMSVRITDPNYRLIGYSETDYKGQSYTITSSVANAASIVVDGQRPFSGGFKSLIPQAIGSEMSKNTCLSHELPFGFPPESYYQPMACNNNKNQLFYLYREDQVAPHTHTSEEIHFHDHNPVEQIHGSG
jgi:hypothetical protein